MLSRRVVLSGHLLTEVARAFLEPFGTPFPYFFFPYGEVFFGAVNRVPAGGEGVGAVGGGNGDADAGLANFDATDAVHERYGLH